MEPTSSTPWRTTSCDTALRRRANELIPINIDIPTAVHTARRALPKIAAIRSRVVSEIPHYDILLFDKLEARTQALWHAHTQFIIASTPNKAIDKLIADAKAKRQLLLSDASALAHRGLLDPKRLQELKGSRGFRNIAFDLVVLASMMRDNWPEISNRTAVPIAELDEAAALGERLLTTIAQRPALLTEAAENRQRAFTLFVSAYDHVRRVITFLRWNDGDVDQIVPSLHAGRTKRRRKPRSATSAGTLTTPPTAEPVLDLPTDRGEHPPMAASVPPNRPFEKWIAHRLAGRAKASRPSSPRPLTESL